MCDVMVEVGVMDVCGNRVEEVRWVYGGCSSSLLGGTRCDL